MLSRQAPTGSLTRGPVAYATRHWMGFLGRKGDGELSAKTLQVGRQRVMDAMIIDLPQGLCTAFQMPTQRRQFRRARKLSAQQTFPSDSHK